MLKEQAEWRDKKHQEFYDDRIGFQFYYLLYQFGFLDFIGSKKDESALLWGRTTNVPYNVHHIRPLCLFGDNDYLNLTLIDEKLHNFVHDFCVPKKVLKAIDAKNDPAKKDHLIHYFLPTFAPIAKIEDYFKECIVCAIRASVYVTPHSQLKKGKRPLSVRDIRGAFSDKILEQMNFTPQAFYKLQSLHIKFRLCPPQNRTEEMNKKLREAEQRFIARSPEKEFLLREMRKNWITLNTWKSIGAHFTKLVLIQKGAQPGQVLTDEGEKKAIMFIARKQMQKQEAEGRRKQRQKGSS